MKSIQYFRLSLKKSSYTVAAGLFVLLLLIPPAWAVYVQAQGDTLTFNNEDGTPLANTTLTGLFEGEEITATTDEEGKLRICRRGEEGDKRICGLILPGNGSGSFGTIKFSFNDGTAAVNFWNSISNMGKTGLAAGTTAGVVTLGLAIGSGGNGDGNNASATTNTTTDGGTTNGGATNGPVSGRVSISDRNPIRNPQGSCNFVFNEIGGTWNFTIDPGAGTASLTFGNGLRVNGPYSNGGFNLTGSGNLTGVNAPVWFNGNTNMSGGPFNGTGIFGPPLGGGNNDLCEARFGGTFTPN